MVKSETLSLGKGRLTTTGLFTELPSWYEPPFSLNLDNKWWLLPDLNSFYLARGPIFLSQKAMELGLGNFLPFPIPIRNLCSSWYGSGTSLKSISLSLVPCFWDGMKGRWMLIVKATWTAQSSICWHDGSLMVDAQCEARLMPGPDRAVPWSQRASRQIPLFPGHLLYFLSSVPWKSSHRLIFIGSSFLEWFENVEKWSGVAVIVTMEGTK